MEERAINPWRRWLMLVVLCLGGGTIFFLPFLRWTYYIPMKEALSLTNTQFGVLMSTYGMAATIFYFPGGWIADRISPRKLLTFSFAATGAAGLYLATYPSYAMCIVLQIFWGLTTTLTFWSALIKATRDMAKSSEQGKFFGLLEGGRGITSTVVSMAVLAMFAKLGGGIYGLTWVIIAYSLISIAVGLVTWFVFEDPKEIIKTGAVFDDVVKVLKMPKAWLIAIIIFSNYFVLSGQTYLTPYLTEVFGATVALSALLSLIRLYGLQIPFGPLGGIVADKTGSPTRVTVYCFAIMTVCMGLFLIIPGSPSLLMVMVLNMVVMGVGIYSMRGVYFAIIDEVKITPALTGATVGFVSMIGFTPDIFIYPLGGFLMDKYPGVLGYKIFFSFMTAVVAIGLVVAIVLYKMVIKEKKMRKDAETVLAT